MATALDLFAHYEMGNMPQGKGVAHESALYRATMSHIKAVKLRAQSWFDEKSRPRK